MQKISLEELSVRYGISAIYLFGSQADTGKRYMDGEDVTPDRYSDLDIAVTFETAPQEVIKTYGELYKDISKRIFFFHTTRKPLSSNELNDILNFRNMATA